MVKVSVKVQYKEDIRRVSFEEKPSYNALYQLLKNLFAEERLEQFSIKYTDDEGDLISVTNDREIAEAWEFACTNNNNFLRLKITIDASARVPVAQFNTTTVAAPTTTTTATTETTVTTTMELTSPQPTQTTTTTTTFTVEPPQVIQNLIDKVIAQVKKIQNETAPEVRQFLSKELEDLVQQFQPVIQQFTAQGYPAQLYANRSQIASSVTSTVENDYYTHVLPLLSSFGVHDIIPKINSTCASAFPSGCHQKSAPKPSTTSTTPSPAPASVSVPEPTAAPSAAFVNVFCHLCNTPITGTRHKCTDCRHYDLCSTCAQHSSKIHSPDHTFVTMQPTSSSSATTPSSPAAVATEPVKERIMSSRLVKDVTIEDGTQQEIKSKFTKTWRMENNGNVAWDKATKLVFVQGDLPCGEAESVEVGTVEAGTQVDVSIAMTAPARPGRYISNFRLVDAQGNKFGHRVWVDIVVIEPELKEEKKEESKSEVVVSTPSPVKTEEKKDENEEKYETLEGMGFSDRKLNARLVAKYKGDLVMVINELCSM